MPMIHPKNGGLFFGSLLSTVILSGCVWKSDYDTLKAQNDQLQQQVDAQAGQIVRL